MPQVSKLSLNAGELSDEMAGRPDLSKFQMGCEILENANVLRVGGVTRRAGFTFGGLAVDQSSKSRLEGFSFSSEQGVVLEFSDLKMNVYKNNVLIAGPYVTPWSESQIFQLNFSQRFDRIIAAHGDVELYSIFRNTDTDWTVAPFPWQVRVWEDPEVSGVSLSSDALSGVVNITSNNPLFDDTWVGQRVQLTHLRSEEIFTGTTITTGVPGTPAQYGTSTLNVVELSPPVAPPGDPPVSAIPATVVTGAYTVVTSGTWTGDLLIERSTDDGVTWSTVTTLTSAGGANFSYPGYEEPSAEVQIRASWTGSTNITFEFNYATVIVAATTGSLAPVIIVSPQLVQGIWSFETSGTWTGEFTIERSLAGGAYSAIKTLTSANDKNFILNESEEPDADALIRVKYDGLQGANYTFTIEGVGVPGCAIISSITNVNTAVATVEEPFISTELTSEWKVEAFSPRNGHPNSSTFHQGRLVLGGSRVYTSRTRRPFDFTLGTNADDGMSFEFDADKYESILWLVSHLSLIVGTTSGIWTISAPDGLAITPESSLATKSVRKAAFKGIPGVHVAENVLFLQRKGRKVHELTGGSVEYGGYTSVDLTQLATQVTRKGVTQLTSAEIPDSSLYLVSGDELSVLTYERQQNVVGWARWKTDGVFESVAVCTGAGENDNVYVVVNRNGVRTVEMLAPDMLRKEEDNNIEELNFLDSSVTKVEVSPFTVITGLDHLEGRTVSVFGDGEPLGSSFVVTGGSVTITRPVSRAVVGLPYTTLIRPMPMDFGAIGSKSVIYNLVLRLRNTLGGEVSQNHDLWSKIEFKQPRGTDGGPPRLLSEDVLATPHSTWKRGTSITLRQEEPLPFTLLALRLKSRTN